MQVQRAILAALIITAMAIVTYMAASRLAWFISWGLSGPS